MTNKRIRTIDLASELALAPVYFSSPWEILNECHIRYQLDLDPEHDINRIDDRISRHTFYLKNNINQLSISFLFHHYSKRWCVDRIRA